MAEIRGVVMRCHSCRWTWDAIVVDGDLEPCPNCDSSDVSIERTRMLDIPIGSAGNAGVDSPGKERNG